MPVSSYNSDLDEFAVAWVEETSVKVQRVSMAGEVIGTPMVLYDTYISNGPALVYNPQSYEYLLVYIKSSMPGGVWAQRLNSSLQAQGSPVQVATFGQNTPKVAYQTGEGLYVVVWRGTPSGGSDGIYSQYLTSLGAASGGLLAVSTGYGVSSNYADVAYDPAKARSLAVFSGNGPSCSGCTGWRMADQRRYLRAF